MSAPVAENSRIFLVREPIARRARLFLSSPRPNAATSPPMPPPIHKPALAAVPVDDATLIAQALEGSDRAFATLYKRHARYLAGVVHRVLGRDDELDDVLQEAFLDASRALGSLRDPDGLRPWLAQITVRRVHKRLARRRLLRRLSSALEWVAPRVSDPAARAEVHALYRALDRLDPKLRIPWVLHEIEGETLPDVATICQASLATVKRRIAQAERELGEVADGN